MKQPLCGLKVLVTRAKNQAGELSDAIRELGGEPIEFAVISMRRPSSPELLERLDAAISNLSAYQWVFFTSVNGVEFFIRRLLELDLNIQSLRGARIAAVGPKTAEALQKYGLTVELIPQEFVSEGFVKAMQPYIQQGDRALLPTADIARTIISEQLSELGMDVTQVIVYENVPNQENGQEIIDLLRNQEIQIVTFTSSSTVRNLLTAIRSFSDDPLDLLKNVGVACIGVKTADTACELGLHVSVIAKEYTIPGLVQSLVEIVSDS
jgi:uroporphyrinogen III methyltransferase / synthase